MRHDSSGGGDERSSKRSKGSIGTSGRSCGVQIRSPVVSQIEGAHKSDNIVNNFVVRKRSVSAL